MDWGLIHTILTIVFGITAAVLAVVTIRRARRKRPVWVYRTTYILGRDVQTPPELRLSFSGREITEVYKTVFVFFNKGNDVIDVSDVAENITIHFKNAEILRQTTLAVSRETNKFSAKQVVKSGDHAVELAFQWLGHNDGAVIEVLHTKSDTPTLSGEIKNVEIVQLKEFATSRPTNFYGNLVVAAGVFVLVAWLGWNVISNAIKTSFADPVSLIAPLAVLAFFISITALGIWRSLRYRTFPDWSRVEP